MFKKIALAAALAAVSFGSMAEVYTLKGSSLKLTMEINNGELSGSRCVEDRCIELPSVKIDKVLEKLDSDNTSIAESLENEKEFYDSLVKKVKEKIAKKEDIFEDKEAKKEYVMLSIFDNSINLPLDIKSSDKNMRNTIKTVVEYSLKKSESGMKLLKQGLPKSFEAKDYREIRLQSDIFFTALNVK